MFEVTEKASEMLKEVLKNQEAPFSVRILVQAGWGGPSLGMALDESKENDAVFTDRDINFLIEKDLLEDAKPILVDFIETERGAGFKLTSSLPAGAGCGSSCSSC